MKLTSRGVDAEPPDPKKRKEIPDAALPGFYLVVQPTGIKSWALRYRHDGRPRKLTLGRYPKVTLSTARDLARDALQTLAKGPDPSIERRSRTDSRNTVAALVEQFDRRHLSQLKSGASARRFLDRSVVAEWGPRKIDSITKRDVLGLLDKIVDQGTPITANRVLAHTRKFFNWAVERDLIDRSPVVGIRAPVKENSRDRVMSDEEICHLWRASITVGRPFGPITQVLLLTGQRLREVAGITTDEISGGEWCLPASRVKNNRAHVVPLSGPVADILNAQICIRDSTLLFSTTGKTPVSGFNRARTRLRAEMPEYTPNWGFHDLRRTAATGMARLGHPIHVVEAVLNHASGSLSGIAAIYNRYDYEAEKRAALEDWARHVKDLVDG